MPRSVPGINSGRPRDTQDIWADSCGNFNSSGRMSAGQTGHITGQMGHVHGTDGTHTRGCPTKMFYVYCFFFTHFATKLTSDCKCDGLMQSTACRTKVISNYERAIMSPWGCIILSFTLSPLCVS